MPSRTVLLAGAVIAVIAIAAALALFRGCYVEQRSMGATPTGAATACW